jgi:dimethylamine/trimethylamine dehydrogenase
LWSDDDIPMLANMAQAMKSHGALAGIELVYPGVNGPNLYTREVPLAPTAMPIRTFTSDPVHAREMDKQDITRLRGWFVQAARRAQAAGFDIVCLYGAHGFGVLQQFLSRATNQRTDCYGGSLENRGRFIRELVDDVRDAVGQQMGISLRLSLDEMLGDLGFSNHELRDFIGMHAELPDLWDLAHGSWEDCSGPSRFSDEAAQLELVRGIRALTTKPVVGVGRFTSPDTMLSQLKSGVLDFIGCARPSIADPFLPAKIRSGRVEDIRECIGCNICISGDMTMSLARCTQNPTFMEEWRKGWHPEKINRRGDSRAVLVVGAGPAGLEATRALGERGYDVSLADAMPEPGGRVSRESMLPGLGTWARVRDYRVHQISQMPNVQVYGSNLLSVDDILAFGSDGFDQVVVATGATWRRDGVARRHVVPLPIDSAMPLYTPDDIMDGTMPTGNIVLFDDDHYYMGGVIAEALARRGAIVTLVTPAPLVSEWTVNTLEQAAIHRRLAEAGVRIELNTSVARVVAKSVTLECTFTGQQRVMSADAVVMVTARQPRDELWRGLNAQRSNWRDTGITNVQVIGDAQAPAPIAWAVYAGHRFARELDVQAPDPDLPSFRRELPDLRP